MTLLPIHIIGGLIAIASGFVALSASKGATRHRKSGMVFVYAMLMMLARGLQERHRLARHVWRMCFAMFIASGSFFLGQAKVFPKPMRIVPLLAIPALLPLVFMLYWLARVWFMRRYPRRSIDSFEQTPVHRLDVIRRIPVGE